MRNATIYAALLLAGLASSAHAAPPSCPDMGRFDVSNISFRGGSLDIAVQRLLRGTPWRAEFDGPATDIRITMIGVGGPMDMILERMIERAGEAPNVASASAVVDREGCVVRVSITTHRPTPSVLVEAPAVAAQEAITAALDDPLGPGEQSHTLPSGTKLSVALRSYVEAFGWTLRWRIEDDFLIDADIPIPEGDVVDGVLHVIRAYQAAGAMRTVRPRFAEPNRVVVIETTGDQL